MSQLLTRDELHDLTGYRQAAAQIRWLVERGWRYTTGADGRPRVLRAEQERHLLGSKARTKELNLSRVA